MSARAFKVLALTVRTVASLVAHQSPVALVGLDNGRRLKVVLVEAVGDLLDLCEVFVELADVNIATLDTIAIGVEGIRLSRLIIGKSAKILRPVSERGGSVVKLVWSGDLVGSSKSLEEQAIFAVIGVPPHLMVLVNGAFYGMDRTVGFSYMIFAGLFAVQDLGALDDAVGGDIGMVLDGLCRIVNNGC